MSLKLFYLMCSSFSPLLSTSICLTLQWQDCVAVDHDAELQDELRCRLQEGLQEAEHCDISALKHQPPVEVAARPVAVPVAQGPQVEGMDVPMRGRQRQRFRTGHFPLQKLDSHALFPHFFKVLNTHYSTHHHHHHHYRGQNDCNHWFKPTNRSSVNI